MGRMLGRSDRLAVALSPRQIKAACRLIKRLTQWQLSDNALEALGRALPGFSPEACLLKSVAVNAIYGTNVIAIVRMAAHVTNVMRNRDAATSDYELVDEIAALPESKGKKVKVRTSFASKFCHFYVDREKFPIYDDAACRTMKLHLGRRYRSDNARRYRAFCDNFQTLRTQARLSCRTRDLDRYLWLTGMYMRWLKPNSKVNAELRNLFGYATNAPAAELDTILPSTLRRTFTIPAGEE